MTALDTRRLPSRRDLGWFGLVLLVFFALLGGVFWWAGAEVAPRVLWAVALLAPAAYYAFPALRLPLYLTWMRLVHPIGVAVMRVALGLIFFGLMTPLGIVMRLFGRDALVMRRRSTRDSYWTRHDPGGEPDRYVRQS